MTVSIVDSSIEIIKRLKELLCETGEVKEIRYALSYHAALQQVKETNPDIVLLDISLPENQSFNLLKLIKKEYENIVVIILSIHMDDQLHSHCKTLGADYFFDKYHEFEKIPDVIRSVKYN